jgi:phage baseplate assembly protein W
VVQTPHLAIPFRLDGSGRFAVVEQDSPDELAACVAVCLATPEGSRAEVPDYGTPRFEFNLPDANNVIAAVAEWEPRVDLALTVAQDVTGDEGLARITALVSPHLGEDSGP